MPVIDGQTITLAEAKKRFNMPERWLKEQLKAGPTTTAELVAKREKHAQEVTAMRRKSFRRKQAPIHKGKGL